MSKRRNAKKEKAARNKINARKFRKVSSRYGRNNRAGSNYNKNNNSNNKQDSSENTSENKSDESEVSNSVSNVAN